MKQKKLLKYLAIATVVLLIFVVIAKRAGWIGKEKPIEVSVEKVQKRTILETVTANGKIRPETDVLLSPEVSGEVIELYVKEGDYVEKGKLLLKIKPDIYISVRDRATAAVNSSKANLANAGAVLLQSEANFDREKQSHDRSKRLWEQKTISLAEWEIAQSSFKTASAQVEAAQQNVKGAQFGVRSTEASLKESNEQLLKTSVVAPMSGTISQLNVELGERVLGTNMMTGTDMMHISDLNRMEVQVDVNENDIVRVSVNDTAIVEVDAYLGKKFKGLVTEIANSATTVGQTTDQVTNFQVKILLLKQSYAHLITATNPDPFRPGMSASLDIQTERTDNVLAIPVQSVVLLKDSTDSIATLKNTTIAELKQREGVYLFVNGKATVKKVKTGIQDNYFIEIKDGLTDKDEVITGPYGIITKRLKEGTQVARIHKKDLFKPQKN